MNDYYNVKKVRTIQDAQHVDPDGLTAFMLLRDLTRSWLLDHTATGWDILTSMEDVREALAPASELLNHLSQEEDLEELVSWTDGLREKCLEWCSGTEHKENLESWLSNPFALADLRLSALLAVDLDRPQPMGVRPV